MTQLARQEGQPRPQAPAAPITYIDDCVANIGHWEDKVKRDMEIWFLLLYGKMTFEMPG